MSGRDKNTWVFNAGLTFEGNPKWLFEYIAHYHPEITLWWFCYDDTLLQRMRNLGFRACLFDSATAKRVGARAGVYVVNQFKEYIQDYLEGATVLNVWHGVGCKTIEKNVHSGFMHAGIVAKQIRNKAVYKKYFLFLATSLMMEKHFCSQCDIDESMIVRAGYPCNIYPDAIATYNHDILGNRGLSIGTRIAVYAPTFRDNDRTGFFIRALPDIDRLLNVLEQHNILLILKMHPQVANNPQYLAAKRHYENCSHLLFWDNDNDFYEVMDKVDLAIVDYSSIFYDLLAHGVTRFVRYIFDYEEYGQGRDFAFDYLDNTCGRIVKTFDDLLDALATYQDDNIVKDDIARIYDRFWSYTTPDTFEILIERARSFEPDENLELPTLYSFDIFDTLIGRSCLLPVGIFHHVQDKMRMSNLGFSLYVMENWPRIRRWGEANAREYRNKRLVAHMGEDRTEIYFEDIYDRIQVLYGITDEQKAQLMQWELECELEASIPYPEQIAYVKSLMAAGETVVLASDMYLPRSFIEQLLEKADPALLELPLYLSSELGSQKTKKTLYYDIYHSMDYRFGAWVHTGDSWRADYDVPLTLGIHAIHEEGIPKRSEYQQLMTEYIDCYDAFQVDNLFARFWQPRRRVTDPDAVPSADIFAYCYASLYFVPYVNWAIQHALTEGIECLYFISRDGYLLKLIADAIIEERDYPIKTKYIYGSRKAWRLPSQIDEIDEDFFAPHGHFSGLTTFDKVVEASQLSEEQLLEMFPQFTNYRQVEQLDWEDMGAIRETMSLSYDYRSFLLDKAREERVIVERYLAQEIDFTEKYAFVEYWGRGYTQTCLARLLWDTAGTVNDNVFYYARSIYPTEGHMVRHNFTGNNYSLIFIEAIFANMPYRSIEEYQDVDGYIEPVIRPCDNNKELFDAQCAFIPQFARDYARIQFEDEQYIDHRLFDWALSYFHNNKTEPVFLTHIAPLKDSPELYGRAREYAPAWTLGTLADRVLRDKRITTNDADITIARSNRFFRALHSTLDKVNFRRRTRKYEKWSNEVEQEKRLAREQTAAKAAHRQQEQSRDETVVPDEEGKNAYSGHVDTDEI